MVLTLSSTSMAWSSRHWKISPAGEIQKGILVHVPSDQKGY